MERIRPRGSDPNLQLNPDEQTALELSIKLKQLKNAASSNNGKIDLTKSIAGSADSEDRVGS